jgi:hypothetical protein
LPEKRCETLGVELLALLAATCDLAADIRRYQEDSISGDIRRAQMARRYHPFLGLAM